MITELKLEFVEGEKEEEIFNFYTAAVLIIDDNVRNGVQIEFEELKEVSECRQSNILCGRDAFKI